MKWWLTAMGSACVPMIGIVFAGLWGAAIGTGLALWGFDRAIKMQHRGD